MSAPSRSSTSSPSLTGPGTGVSTSVLEGLRLWLAMIAEVAYQQHRLVYVHHEDDEPLFGCKCGEGFSERQHWNAHIRDSFANTFYNVVTDVRIEAHIESFGLKPK